MNYPARLLAIPLIIVLLVALLAPSKRLLAEIYEEYGTELSSDLQNIGVAREALRFPIKLMPDSFEYRIHLAELAFLEGDAATAGQIYRSAIIIHPSWPYGWLSLMRITLSQNGKPAELESLILRTAELGQQERNVRFVLAVLGLEQSERLTPASRKITDDSIRFALRHSRDQFLGYVYKTGQDMTICDHYAEDAELVRWCQSRRQLRALCLKAGVSIKLHDWCRDRYALPAGEQLP